MEKSKNEKRRQTLISASWFSFPQYIWPLSRCIQNLKTLVFIEAEKSVTEIFIGEKENGQLMGMISRRRLILSNTIQQVISNICTKFQNPRFSISWEIFDERKFTLTHTHTKKKKKKKKKKNIVTEKTKTIYPLYTSYTGDISRVSYSGMKKTLKQFYRTLCGGVWSLYLIGGLQTDSKAFILRYL